MRDPTSQSVQTKVAFFTITGYQTPLSHPFGSGLTLLPVVLDATVDQGQTEINLEIVTSIVALQVLLPHWGSDACGGQETNNDIACMDHTVQHPAEHAQIVADRAECGRPISSVTIIFVNRVEFFE